MHKFFKTFCVISDRDVIYFLQRQKKMRIKNRR